MNNNEKNRFMRIAELLKPELTAAVDSMTPEERRAFRLWLTHEDDQRYAKVARAGIRSLNVNGRGGNEAQYAQSH